MNQPCREELSSAYGVFVQGDYYRKSVLVRRPVRLWWSVACALLCIILGLAHAPKALGQAEQGTFTGVITDHSGAVVSGVTVTAKEVATQTVSSTTTNKT